MCLFIETFTFGFYLALCNLRPFRNCEILPKEHICGKVSCIISQVGDFSADKGCCPPPAVGFATDFHFTTLKLAASAGQK